MTAAIVIDGVTKRFKIGGEKFDSLKDRLIHLGRVPSTDFWALKGIDLEIARGETFGLLGHNGSGKSTLLKCVAGVLEPTAGQVRSKGRMSALLELGAGFHPDLTGRENVELNGLLLGLDRKAIASRFDEIVDFAGPEVAEAIDRQVKFYSSGMYVRLGFAVAVSIDPEILLVDEVLSVGDEAFQRKCLNRVKQLQGEGCTIVLVSHAADQVRQICDRAAVLDHGKLVCVDTPGVAIRNFRDHLYATGRVDEAQAIEYEPDPDTLSSQPPQPERIVRFTDITVRHPHDTERRPLLPGEPLSIEAGYESTRELDDLNFGIAFHDGEGRVLYGANTRRFGIRIDVRPGKGLVRWKVAAIPLLDGDYKLSLAIQDQSEAVVYDWIDAMDGFEVLQTENVLGMVALDVAVEHEPDLGAAD
ncbi:MAG: ABC transporter ATP-binding protein [Acidimicrobiales bacterium]